MSKHTNCYEYRITLKRDTVECRCDEPGRVDFPLREGQIDRSSHLETILVLEEWLKRWEWIARTSEGSKRLLVPDTFKILGNHLWNLAFAGSEAGQRIVNARRAARSIDPDLGSTTIRVRMSFDKDASDLAALPWEFIRFPGSPNQQPFLLATETNLVLDRYLSTFDQTEQAFRAADERVRVLFVLSLPKTETYADEREGVEGLRQKLHERGQVDVADHGALIDVDCVDGWDAEEVRKHLDAFKTAPHPGPIDVVHLVGLCRLRRPAKLELFLPSSGGGPDWNDPDSVVDVLTRDMNSQPQLVVLHLCDSDEEVAEHLEQLAPSFIMAGIPAVLAMQYPMRPQICWPFVQTFYERLANGENVGEAVQSARRDLRNGTDLAEARQFGIPVLFMQSKVDGSLVQRRVANEGGQLRVGVIPSSLPSRRQREAAAPASLKPFLLDELDKLHDESPSDTVLRLQEWLERTGLPEGTDQVALDRVKKVIRSKRRELQHDSAAVQICQRLLQVLRERFEGAGSA